MPAEPAQLEDDSAPAPSAGAREDSGSEHASAQPDAAARAAEADRRALAAEATAGEDDEQPVELDPEVRARRDAALRHVRKLGDPVLRARAVPVERFDDKLQQEVERMGRLMQDALGVGLAATQVGVMHRVFVYRVDPEEPVKALVNPVLESTSDELETAEEGCLSIPGVQVEVERPAEVRVSGQDPAGEHLEFDASGLEARVIQHELDHLNGVLILDRISRERRREAMREMREMREPQDA